MDSSLCCLYDCFLPFNDRLVVGQSLKLRRVVPVLGVPDALVPLDLPLTQLSLLPGYYPLANLISYLIR